MSSAEHRAPSNLCARSQCCLLAAALLPAAAGCRMETVQRLDPAPIVPIARDTPETRNTPEEQRADDELPVKQVSDRGLSDEPAAAPEANDGALR